MKFGTALSFAAALLLSTSFMQAEVHTDFDHQADFSKYHTYSWGNVKTDNPLNVARIKSEVDKDLQAKGWQLMPSGASTTVFATGNIKNEKEMETFYNGFGGGWGGGFGRRGFGGFGNGFGGGFGGLGNSGEATTTTNNLSVGHLILDIFDNSNHNLLFRGNASNDISNKADKNTKNIDKDIDMMFKKFPPKETAS